MITGVVITKNEEARIVKCLKRLAWCDEVVVVDDNSIDDTRHLAKKHGARVFKRSLGEDFASQRNFALEKASGDWVFFVDADELVTAELAEEIVFKLKDPEADGYLVKRQDVFMGGVMTGGEWGGQYLLRLGKKKAGKWRREVHEAWEINGKIKKLSSPLLHSPASSLGEFIDKLNRYSSMHALSNKNEGKKPDFLKITYNPLLKFVYNFIIKRGFSDGVYGFVYAALMSFHSFLAWSKLWLDSQKIK